jgi:putative aldouronate transport system substrate-binding protein
MPRILSVILIIALTLTLGGCSGEWIWPQGQTSVVDGPQGGSGAMKLSIMLVSWSNTPPPKDNPFEKRIEEITDTNLELTWVHYNEYESRQNVGLTSGDIPDMVQLLSKGPQLFTSVQAKAIEAGVFHNLAEYINAPDFADKYPNLGKIPRSLWEKVSFKGGIYAIPRNIEPETFTGIWLREDLLERKGLPVPLTTDELADTLIELTDPSKQMYGLDLDGAGQIDSAPMKAIAAAFTGIADWGVNDLGDFVYRDFTPEYKDYLAWLKKLYNAKAIHPEFALGQKSATFKSGTAAAVVHRWHSLLPAEKPYAKFENSVDPGAKAVLIKPVKGPKMYSVDANRGFWTQNAISSNVAKENIPHILAFLDWMASDEALNLFLNGIEGIHYEMKNGRMDKNQDMLSNDGIGGEPWIMQTVRDADYFFNDLLEKRGGTAEELKTAREAISFTEEKYAEARKELNYGNHHFNLYSPTLLSQWDRLTKNLQDNRVKVIMGKMSFDEWDRYVNGITSSSTYKQILEELKAEYVKNKQ